MDHDRREFLKTTTGLLTGVVLAGSPLALIAPGRAWAVEMTAFTSSEGSALMALARTIAPHDKLDDAAYAMVVQAVDVDAAKDENLRKMTKDGIARLGADFAKSPESERVLALKKIESSEFFQTMRLKTLQVLYATPHGLRIFRLRGRGFLQGRLPAARLQRSALVAGSAPEGQRPDAACECGD